MRLILRLVLPCLLITGPVFSQVNGNYNYALGIRGFEVMQLPKIFNQDAQKYLSGKLTGAIIKFSDNQISYRISGSRLNQQVNFDHSCTNCDLAKGKILDYSFKVGFEKNFNYARLQPYFALDLGYRYNRFSGRMSTVDNQNNIAAVNSAIDTKDGGTAAAIVGLKINPIEQASLFIESGLEFYYSYIKQQTTLQDVNATKNTIRFNRGDFLLNAVSIGIQVHLGNKN